MSSLHDITARVREGSEKMLSGSQQVINEGKNLVGATEEISGGINEIASGADYINSAIVRVYDISGENKEHIAALYTEVERFKVEKTEYVWDKTFAVGQEKIDEQHRQLFKALNSIVKACNENNRASFKESVEFLSSYVNKHFVDEEEIQKNSGYPDYPNHKKLHDAYKIVIDNLTAKWMASGPTESALEEIKTHVASWLVEHIKAQDFKIGAFIRSKK